MKINTTGFRDKTSKNPAERRLYEVADTFLEAYANHTDWRIENRGPAEAIGGEWEEHGPLQLEFLKSKGLLPHHRLLDFGCGTGRFARHAVPFLRPYNYVGIDISKKAIAYCEELARKEGWSVKRPMFVEGGGGLSQVEKIYFDMIWAHSVFTHLPQELITAFFQDLAEFSFDSFFFTYKKADKPNRSGYKQFQYPLSFFEGVAKSVGLKVEGMNTKMRGQYIAGCIKK